MPKIDFKNVEDVKGFSPLPGGTYLCKVAEVEEGATQRGDEMWRVRFVVESGVHKGRYIFDSLVFSAAAMKRVKLFCSSVGIDVAGEQDLTPDAIIGRTCNVTVTTEEYENPEGQTRFRNSVPFAGYGPPDDENGAPF